jgi:NitT/TauT family transport system substrate-binding protein
VDAVCVTNTDTLNPCIGRPGTAILPTSTSDGADAVISTVTDNVEGLKTVSVYGLSKSVSEYLFRRGLEVKGLNPKDFKFVHLDPGPAATALQTDSSEIKAIDVWNPFKLTVLRKNPKAKVIFDSTLIPLEIIDMVVVANDSLKKNKGEDFAKAICEIYYKVAAAKDDPATSEATLGALGEDFFALSPADMKICCTETKFFGTPELGIALFTGELKDKNVQVLKTCKDIGIIEKEPPTVGYDDPSKQLNFSTVYMKAVK